MLRITEFPPETRQHLIGHLSAGTDVAYGAVSRAFREDALNYQKLHASLGSIALARRYYNYFQLPETKGRAITKDLALGSRICEDSHDGERRNLWRASGNYQYMEERAFAIDNVLQVNFVNLQELELLCLADYRVNYHKVLSIATLINLQRLYIEDCLFEASTIETIRLPLFATHLRELHLWWGHASANYTPDHTQGREVTIRILKTLFTITCPLQKLIIGLEWAYSIFGPAQNQISTLAKLKQLHTFCLVETGNSDYGLPPGPIVPPVLPPPPPPPPRTEGVVAAFNALSGCRSLRTVGFSLIPFSFPDDIVPATLTRPVHLIYYGSWGASGAINFAKHFPKFKQVIPNLKMLGIIGRQQMLDSSTFGGIKQWCRENGVTSLSTITAHEAMTTQSSEVKWEIEPRLDAHRWQVVWLPLKTVLTSASYRVPVPLQ